MGKLRSTNKGDFEEMSNRFSNLGAEEITSSEIQQPSEQGIVRRDTFTFPRSDYQIIETLKEQCLRAGVAVSKSEIIRAGLHALKNLDETQLLEVVKGIEKIKTGKPKQNNR